MLQGDFSFNSQIIAHIFISASLIQYIVF